MRQKVKNNTRSRSGNGSPFSSAAGSATAAASDTTPRIPDQLTSVDTRADAGSTRWIDGTSARTP